jgi:hypothetical protein
MGFVFGLVFDAAIIGIIVAVLSKGEFPGWGPMIGVVFAIWISSNAAMRLLPDGLWFLGLVAGAAVGALILTWLGVLEFRRSLKAAGIYLGVRLVMGFMLAALISA